jgi:hypothetical protein
VLGCQLFIEVLMLLLYLYARTLARKAFGAAPNHEARSLFMYLLLSDGACARTNAKCIPNHGEWHSVSTPMFPMVIQLNHECAQFLPSLLSST